MPIPQDANSIEKWNQVLFENANKCHTHQDNLRWTLSGGFGAFFYGSILLLNNEKIYSKEDLVNQLHILFFVMGTLYWIAISIEGWYYNFYLNYLIECEEKIILGEKLYPITKFDRKKVKMFHPSFSSVLILIAVANSYHLFSFSSSITLCLIYITVAVIISVKGNVFKRIEITKSRRDLNINDEDARLSISSTEDNHS